MFEVTFNVSVSEAGQLTLSLNSGALTDTGVGRATGTRQITGTYLVTTTSVTGSLSVINPAGNSTALTITPPAGGTRPVSATFLIERIAYRSTQLHKSHLTRRGAG